MRVFLIGAAGGVGRRLAALLTKRGDEVSGMHREGSQSATVTAGGATPVIGDLIADSAADLAEKFRGHDAVVFSAGAHGTGLDKTTAIDGDGLRKAVDAAALAGVSRFAVVSVFLEAGRGPDSSAGFEHYMAVKKDADVYLAASDLDWIILRPGQLLDDPGTGSVTAGPAIHYGAVTRDDVAAFLAAVLHEGALSRVIIELTGGGTPVDQAVANLVAGQRA
ncbi:SDR family oxidoreductase [Nakamurella silvestris]|nr:SDR family oxidoreductase [Nakamurella silvestris]